MTGDSTRLQKFLEYYETGKSRWAKIEAEDAPNREAFIKEYPLEWFKTMTPEDYCMGYGGTRDSLSYHLEFGKYKGTACSIGGGSAQKFGIFYSKKENCYRLGAEQVDNIDDIWDDFRTQLYDFLIDSKDAPSKGDYPLLKGMSSVLSKLLYIYYPDNYLGMSSRGGIREIMDYYGYDYTTDMDAYDLTYRLKRCIYEDVPELKKEEGISLSAALWRFNSEELKGSDPVQKAAKKSQQYWIYSPGDNASMWDEFYKDGIMAIRWGYIGDLRQYASKAEMKEKMKEVNDPDKTYRNAAHATWQFANDIQIGDVVFVKKGMHELIGRGVVTSDYFYDESRKGFENVRKVNWTNNGHWDHPGQAVMKTLTNISNYTDYVEELNALFGDSAEIDPDDRVVAYDTYDEEMFFEQVYMEEEKYRQLVALIKAKKNVILQGPPGVGKTYSATRLCYSLVGALDPNRVMMIQFHQSYSYEDFIVGYRPTEKGYELKYGAFYEFCKNAEEDSDNDYYFLIDEINRGNLSKIFGELFMLIESDKRGVKLQLLYGNERFSVPENVYIIGMMNTADRSLALLDYALRRRFAFFDLKPSFDTEGFRGYQDGLKSDKFDRLIEAVKRLNHDISDDSSLGEGFEIGHSFFCGITEVTDDILERIVEFELIPLLKEYWFDEDGNVQNWKATLRNAIR